MNMVLTLILAAQMLSALGMIGLILVQHGKGADMGAAFGGGSSGSLFGASGSANFLSRTTAVLAGVFLVCTLALSYFGGAFRTTAPSGSVFDRAGVVAPRSAVSAALPAASDPLGQIPSGAAVTGAAGAVDPSVPTVPAAPAMGASEAGQIPTR
ncbi:MAG: preprotein translocase subunit SecG [Burkholderiales bacterium]